jgi:hypothetical protein
MEATHCYLSDIPRVRSQIDTLPMLIRRSSPDVVYRTDDGRTVKAGVRQIPDKTLDARLSFLVSPAVIQPNPMIWHHPIDGQPRWLEIEFPFIYRVPCAHVNLKSSITVKNETHWIIDEKSAVDFRVGDQVLWADGNNPFALVSLIEETLLDGYAE